MGCVGLGKVKAHSACVVVAAPRQVTVDVCQECERASFPCCSRPRERTVGDMAAPCLQGR